MLIKTIFIELIIEWDTLPSQIDGLGRGRQSCAQNGCRRFLCSRCTACTGIPYLYLYLGTIDETLVFRIVLLWTGLLTRMRTFRGYEGRGLARAWKTLLIERVFFSLSNFFFFISNRHGWHIKREWTDRWTPEYNRARNLWALLAAYYMNECYWPGHKELVWD